MLEIEVAQAIQLLSQAANLLEPMSNSYAAQKAILAKIEELVPQVKQS